MSRIIGIICSLIIIIAGLYLIIKGNIDGTIPVLIGILSIVLFILSIGKPHNFDRNIK